MKKNFICDKENISVIEFLSDKLIFLEKYKIQKQLELKEIKINSKRICENVILKKNDSVDIFLPQSFDSVAQKEIEIVYKDENILIVDKPVLCDVENHLISYFKKTFPVVLPVHRLDRNTEGLTILALNKESYEILTAAFKSHSIEKTYSALVYGILKIKSAVLTAYLKKDDKNMKSLISEKPINGYTKIVTAYTVTEEYGNYSKLKINLITGKMHQIRAHLAFINHPVLGDGKYGNNSINKQFPYKYQQLCAQGVKFLGLEGKLAYLNNKEITRK